VPEVESLYQAAIMNIRGKRFDECSDGLNALSFLQEVLATAMWKHRCVIGDVLESFVRKYDRLDIPEERRKLHLEAQR
jgi:hypothetical protein